jgi:hypothetical protein
MERYAGFSCFDGEWRNESCTLNVISHNNDLEETKVAAEKAGIKGADTAAKDTGKNQMKKWRWDQLLPLLEGMTKPPMTKAKEPRATDNDSKSVARREKEDLISWPEQKRIEEIRQKYKRDDQNPNSWKRFDLTVLKLI